MHKYINKKNIKIRNKSISTISIIIIIIILFSTIIITSKLLKPSGNENITTKLNTETDFLNWFEDFDNLYNRKIKYPKYSLTKEVFEKINNYINNDNNNNIYFKDNIYYINNTETIELDVNTRSLRYTKYHNNKTNEILEINLINGKYYVQFTNSKSLYKISFNKDIITKDKEDNNKQVIIKDSIYGKKDFNW